MKTNVNNEIENIMNCFSGADGGISFANFKGMMETLKNDDSGASREIEEVVRRFSRLINCASK